LNRKRLAVAGAVFDDLGFGVEARDLLERQVGADVGDVDREIEFRKRPSAALGGTVVCHRSLPN
jgi:hypothetical protein